MDTPFNGVILFQASDTSLPLPETPIVSGVRGTAEDWEVGKEQNIEFQTVHQI